MNRGPRFLPWLGPLLVLLCLQVLVPELLPGPERALSRERQLQGGWLGIVLGSLAAFGVGRWIDRALEAGGGAFLKPMAGGFLLKLLLLGAVGGWLGFLQTEGPGFEAFALAFVASAFGWNLLFLLGHPRLGRPPGGRGS